MSNLMQISFLDVLIGTSRMCLAKIRDVFPIQCTELSTRKTLLSYRDLSFSIKLAGP